MEDRTSKIVENLKEVYKNVKKGPVRILLDPTDKCNLRCKFCWQRGKNVYYDNELSDKRLLKLIKEAAELDVKEWVISGGGDPLARAVTFRLLEKIKKHNMWGQIITNSLLLNEESIKKLVGIKWDQIQISMDGANTETHDLLRDLPGAFEKVKTILLLFKKYKKESKSDKPFIGFNTVLCSENYKQVHEIIKIAHEYNVEQVWFEMIAPWSESAKQFILTDKQKQELKKYAKKATKLSKRYNIFTNIDYYIEKPEQPKDDNLNPPLKQVVYNKGLLSAFCLAPWFSIKIHPTGVVGPCCAFYRHEPLGNLHKESLKGIWGKNFCRLREAMLQNNPPAYCKECTKGQIAEMEDIRKRLRVALKGQNGQE